MDCVFWILIALIEAPIATGAAMAYRVRDRRVRDLLRESTDQRLTIHELRAEVRTHQARVDSAREARDHWHELAIRDQGLFDEERKARMVAEAKLITLLTPIWIAPDGSPVEISDPMTVAEADRVALEQARALARREAEKLAGREPVLVTDDDVQPPMRLTRDDATDGYTEDGE